MRLQTVTLVLSILAIRRISAQDTGKLGDAATIDDNPAGASFIANLPSDAFFSSAYPGGGNVQGSVQAVSSPDGTGVLFQVKLSNLPAEGGPFLYHIHDQPVPGDGNCTGTLAHLDPYERGEATPCDATRPETCQVGDLAGKHGTIGTEPFNATYTDYYAAALSGIGAYFGNRSIVVHFNNKTRLTCANFTVVDECGSRGASSSSSSSATSTTVSSNTSTTGIPTGETPTTTGSLVGTNETATATTPPVVTAAAATKLPPVILGVGAAVLAFAL